MRKNIFVIGDLVVDHTIFVRETALRPHQSRENELVFEVIRRHNSAGGSANTARLLAVMNQGKTFLWGSVGQSRWGSFQQILEKSQELDGAAQRIVFRVPQEESSTQMHTISRVISVRGDPPDFHLRRIWVRFDDFEDFYLTDTKRLTVVDDIKEVHHKHSLGAIIISDLDLNCISKNLVKSIAQFCKEQSPPIALFVDPKFDSSKYSDVDALTVLPNLYEWLRLVGERDDRLPYWRGKLDSRPELIEMAQLSLLVLPFFDYYVIKCDRDGCVVLCPSQDPFKYSIYRIHPRKVYTGEESVQMGLGDVLVGALALAFDTTDPTPHKFLIALDKATRVVESYLAQPWLQMPRPDVINGEDTTSDAWISEPVITFPAGVKYLPKKHLITLSEHEVISGLYTNDERFKRVATQIVKDATEGWGSDLRSIIVGAPPGSGKSSIVVTLLKSQQVSVRDVSSEIHTFNSSDPEQDLKKITTEYPAGARVLLIADESLKAERRSFLEKSGVLLLNAAHRLGIRIMFIDSGFFPDAGILGNEISSRCRLHVLPSLDERPIDIPLIVVSRLFSQSPRLIRVEISANTLLMIVNHLLTSATLSGTDRLSPRNVVNVADTILQAAEIKHGTLRIYPERLPMDWRTPNIPLPDRVPNFIFTP